MRLTVSHSLPLLLATAALLALAAPPARAGDAALQLPDLDQEAPSQLGVLVDGEPGRPVYRLGFRSAVRNVGDGPLLIDGSRPDQRTPWMAATQEIQRTGQAPLLVPGAGRLRYVVSPDHRHWHLLHFDRYELRRVDGSASARRTVRPVRDRKSGFCLGDRYRATGVTPPAAAPEALLTGRCGLTHPELLSVREGISVGWGDDYDAFLEYQDLPLTGLSGGRYLLVHRVNADRRLRETSYANDAASVLLDVRWRKGVPQLRQLAVCADSATCAAPAKRSAVTSLARTPSPSDPRLLCPLVSPR